MRSASASRVGSARLRDVVAAARRSDATRARRTSPSFRTTARSRWRAAAHGSLARPIRSRRPSTRPASRAAVAGHDPEQHHLRAHVLLAHQGRERHHATIRSRVPAAPIPRACNDISPTINPQLGATIRLTERLGLGLLVIGPSSRRREDLPRLRERRQRPGTRPRRAVTSSIQQKGIILFPTIGVGYEVARQPPHRRELLVGLRAAEPDERHGRRSTGRHDARRQRHARDSSR